LKKDSRFARVCRECSFSFIAGEDFGSDYCPTKCPLCESKLYDPINFKKDGKGNIIKR